MNTLLKLKSSVNPSQIKPEVLLALQVALTIWDRQSEPVLTITSIADSKHGPASLHYVGYAVDIRIRELRSDPKLLSDALRDSLVDDYDVILESNHIHLEYQPKWKT